MRRWADILLGSCFLVMLGCSLGLVSHYLHHGQPALLRVYPPPLPAGMREITLEDAALFFAGGVPFVDARTQENYERGHVAGAYLVNEDSEVPQELLDDQRRQNSLVIVYCEGASCGASRRVADKLLQSGVPLVGIMSEGWPAWERVGRDIRKGNRR